MSDKSLDKNAIRQQASETFNLTLTDAEIEALLAGEPLSFARLIENRSLSELGVALIRADAIRTERLTDEQKKPEKVFCIPPGGKLCFDLRTASFQLHK